MSYIDGEFAILQAAPRRGEIDASENITNNEVSKTNTCSSILKSMYLKKKIQLKEMPTKLLGIKM